jgi:hypothetical protein
MQQGGPLSDRKYRQPGYMDRRDDTQKRSAPSPAKRQETFGPRAIQMPGTRTVSRCSQCGTVLTMLSEPLGQCAKCGFELHSCKQCSYFDPSSRFECTQGIAARIPRKDQRNECTFYSIRVMVEKETSTSSGRADDARKAFEALFKK